MRAEMGQPLPPLETFLAAAMDKHPGLNRLEARALLVRGKSPTDGRKQTLNLTDAGREILERAKLAIRDHETWLKSRFTDKEVSKLIELLTRIHE